MYYQREIAKDLKAMGVTDVAPRVIEAWMRLEHGSLGHLTAERFRCEVINCIQLARAVSAKRNEDLARSFGL